MRPLLTLLLAACLSVTANASEPPLELIPGETIKRTAAGDTGITYHVYVPKNYEASAGPSPIIITFSPGGDGLGILKRIKEGTEHTGWLLIGCDKLKNGIKDRDLALKMEDEVLDDILATLPHDPDRIYLAGFSGGAMRSYDLTTRRPEPFAGILAYGGWLGGSEYQGNAFREGMSVAMINGNQDRGAGAWVATDTARLRELNNTIKHYCFIGGHGVAPVEITTQAVDWLDQQWHAKPTKKSPLRILYVGDDATRTNAFRAFLSDHFTTVNSTTPDALTIAATNLADVLVLDAPVVSLPDNFPKAMVMIGPSAFETAGRYGSKLRASSMEPSDGDLFLSKAFQGAEPINTSFDPETIWADSKTFGNLEDSEVFSSGLGYLMLAREAHRFFWGYANAPSGHSDSGRHRLVKAINYIHEFDGHQQTLYRGLRTRTELLALLEDEATDRTTLERWLSASLLAEAGDNPAAIRAHLQTNAPYLQVPHGSGLFRIDAQAQQFETPNNQVDSIQEWIDQLEGDDGKAALNLLLTYTGQRIHRQLTQWQTWLDENRDILEFSDDHGYRWQTSP